MGFQFGGTSATVNIAGGITTANPILADNQSRIIANGTTGNPPTTQRIIYTPTASKTFYVTKLVLKRISGYQQSGTHWLYIRDNTTNIWFKKLVADEDTQEIIDFPIPLSISTNVNLILVSGGGSHTAQFLYSLQGYEV